MGNFPSLSPVNCQVGDNLQCCNKHVPLLPVAVRMKNQTNDDHKETYIFHSLTINHKPCTTCPGTEFEPPIIMILDY